jgi:type II secretory pathway pseudopilin PulG
MSCNGQGKPKPMYPSRKTDSRRARGFALIATLSLMILLAILAVGLLSLSSVVLRSSSRGDAQAEARANARMALMMAIGELQRELGPDSRISAPHDAGSEATGGQPHWVAVYDAWKWNENPGDPEIPQGRKLKFRKWLVSGTNQTGGTGESATLIGKGSLGADAKAQDEVRAPLQAVALDKRSGAYAWWVSDESTKAKVNAGPDPATGGATNPLFHAQAAPNVNQKAIPTLSGFDWKKGKRAISVSTPGLLLAADLKPGDLGATFHDITVHSSGVLADVRAGRLKRDLSHLLSRTITEMEDKPLYLSDGRINRFDITAEGTLENSPFVPSWSGAQNTSGEWGINLEELHLFHNVHREVVWSGGQPSLRLQGNREEAVKDRFFLYKRPVIDAVQFILSLKAEPFNGDYRMVMMLDGMVALSNPNDVPISWPSGLILPVQLQNVPYSLTWKITNKDGGVKNTKTADSANFGLFVGRVGGGTSAQNPAAGFTLEPGESAVFGSTTGSGAQLDLMRGFQPSGGVRIAPSTTNGWNLQASGLKTDDKIDFTLVKGDVGFNGTHTYYNAWIGDRRTGANATGWQIDGCSLISGNLSSPRMEQMLISPIRPPQVRQVSEFITQPQPIMMINFLRNQEKSSGAAPPDAFASRPFHLNEPSAAGRGLLPASIDASLHANQMLITAEPLNFQFRTLAAGAGGRHIYQGGGRQPNLGGSFHVIKRRIPIAPPMSLGAFENAIASGFNRRMRDAPAIAGDPFPSDAMTLSGHNTASPSLAKVIGNSWSNPFLTPRQVHKAPTGTQADTRTAADHSWMANTALWDSWFLSGIVDGGGTSTASWLKDTRNPRTQFSDLAKGMETPRNSRLLFFKHKPADQAIDELFEASGNFKPSAINKLANYLMVDGAFNVNSTSVNAWAAFLSSVRDQEVLTAAGTGQEFEHPFGTLGYAANTAVNGTDGDWRGLRSLSSGEILELAEAIVTEVRERGPFLNLADFVNRRPDSSVSEHRALGALQAAIDSSGINNRFTGVGRALVAGDFAPLTGDEVIAEEPYPSRSVGAAGYLSQAALLTPMGSQITVRGDTFSIRAYGDTRNVTGEIVAKAWCEAVVQRVPEYLNPTDSPEAQDGWPLASGELSAENRLFGRRFEIRSFRWLHADEI